jgi:hypothetical protein
MVLQPQVYALSPDYVVYCSGKFASRRHAKKMLLHGKAVSVSCLAV